MGPVKRQAAQPAAAFSSFDPQAPLIRPKSSAAALDRRGPLADYRDICWAIGSELLSSVNVSSKRPHRASLASLGALFRRKFGRKWENSDNSGAAGRVCIVGFSRQAR